MGIEAVLEKVKWTRHHFDLLNQAVIKYVDPENTKFFVERYDEAKTFAWGHFDSVCGPPTEISHIFGDVIQSANSCLDYLICELYGRYNNSEPGKPCHKFPLAASHGAFNGEIGSNALYGIPFEAVAVVESLQPYDGRTDHVNSRLLTLRRLTNDHKHRKLQVAALTACTAPSNVVPFEQDGEFYIKAEDLPKPVHFKAPIGPVAVTDNGTKVDVEGKYAAVVVLEESGLRDTHITLLAERLCQAVTVACKRFTPFFFDPP
jgi:hypothetical protein